MALTTAAVSNFSMFIVYESFVCLLVILVIFPHKSGGNGLVI